MQCKIVSKDKSTSKFPYLGINATENMIVLFTSKDTGSVVYIKDLEVSGFYMGQYSETWNETTFTHYLGEVVMAN